jgi:hypothetical protein
LKYKRIIKSSKKQSVFCTGWKACATKFFAFWRIIRVRVSRKIGQGTRVLVHYRGGLRELPTKKLSLTRFSTNCGNLYIPVAKSFFFSPLTLTERG